MAVIGAVVAGFVVGAGLLVLKRLRSRKGTVDPDSGLGEKLAAYPAAPRPGTHRLTFEGQPVRLRLVVLAPAGRAMQLNSDMAEGVLQAIFHGLGEVADLDRPRIRIWPGQLSQEGFAPKFFENVDRGESQGKPSRWILAAGPAQAGQRAVLLGLALEATSPMARGNVRMDAEKWMEKLRVQVVG
jgi:hypothetical protein